LTTYVALIALELIMRIAVVGTGYVGLVTGACFADVGHTVYCLDIDRNKIENLRKGIMPIYEPGLEDIVKESNGTGNLSFTTDPSTAIENAEIVFIAVGTPPDEDGSADLQYVLAVAETIAEHMPENCIVVDKSTVPVGTADKVKARIEETMKKQSRSVNFHVCSNPEFLKEGSAVEDFMRPSRIIVGTDSVDVEAKMRQCYAPFNRNHDRMMVMDIRSAELTKYAANAMLATKISFINEIAGIAEEVGADIEAVRVGIGSDPRIGYNFIYPGAGYGGSCFPKDVRALVNTAKANGLDAKLLSSVEAVNNHQKTTLWKKLSKALADDVAGKTIAIWGLAFKPNTDDMRDAPSRSVIESILEAGGKIQAFDPVAGDEALRLYGHRENFTLAGTKDAAASGADALVICTEWNEFRIVDFKGLGELLNSRIIIDGRNIVDLGEALTHDFQVSSIGRADKARSLS